MKSILIEDGENGQKAYSSLVMEPSNLGIFANEPALKIVRELSRKPGCAMDLARRLEMDEQKIYYHLRKLEKAGVVSLAGTETRYGMTAKIYRTVAPAVSAKLYDAGERLEKHRVRDPRVVRFLRPFIENGRLNAKIIIGSPHPHGRHEASARDGAHITDLALFLGGFLRDSSPGSYRVDTEVRPDDLKGNLILIGGPKINTISDKVNRDLPVYFDEKNNFSIVSRLSGERYYYNSNAVIVRVKNPFNRKREILLLAGKSSSGLKSAVLALINHTEEIMAGNAKERDVIAKVVNGVDRDGDGIIDSVRILE